MCAWEWTVYWASCVQPEGTGMSQVLWTNNLQMVVVYRWHRWFDLDFGLVLRRFHRHQIHSSEFSANKTNRSTSNQAKIEKKEEKRRKKGDTFDETFQPYINLLTQANQQPTKLGSNRVNKTKKRRPSHYKTHKWSAPSTHPCGGWHICTRMDRQLRMSGMASLTARVSQQSPRVLAPVALWFNDLADLVTMVIY